MRAVDEARPGVVFHCQAGWDRTGMVAALLLKRAGVAYDAIVADYALSWTNPDPDRSADARRAKLAESGTTWETALRDFLRSAAAVFPPGPTAPVGDDDPR